MGCGKLASAFSARYISSGLAASNIPDSADTTVLADCDLILHSLSEAARRAFKNMRAFKYEYQSDFARHYFGQGRMKGRAEGRAEGSAEMVLRLLTLRFGDLDDAAKARIAAASLADLDAIAERLLTAQTLQEALG